MDALGIESRVFRMRSGCDTTTPCAQLILQEFAVMSSGQIKFIDSLRVFAYMFAQYKTMVPRGLDPRALRLLAARSNQLSYETSLHNADLTLLQKATLRFGSGKPGSR